MSPVVKVVELSGILDWINANKLRQEMSDVVKTKPDIVLIDLQNVTFMDSSGLGAVLSAMKAVNTAGGKLFVCSINDQVRLLF